MAPTSTSSRARRFPTAIRSSSARTSRRAPRPRAIPLHLLAGANDYRTVDLPGTLDPLKGFEANADAWLGLFKSFDGGQTWRSTLVPGFPQDTSAIGKASPIKGRQAATDPVVRAGTNGLFYYAGVAFDRGEHKPSAIFVARFIDLNNRENGDPIAYLGTKQVAFSAELSRAR